MNEKLCTADLYDAFGDRCSSCETQFRQYAARLEFSGKTRTVKGFGDNSLLRRTLETRSEGEVLVVGGPGYLGSTLVGDLIAELGTKNGWSGVVIFGAIRGARAIARFCLRCGGTWIEPTKEHQAGRGVRRYCRLVRRTYFYSGPWLYSDDDGVLVSREQLLTPADQP